METTLPQDTLADTGDTELIARILAGEKRLFEAIIRRYNPRLYRTGMSIVNDAQEVEELMQSAYVKAYEHLGSFKGESQFGTWLMRILINECLQYLKRKQRHAMVHIDGSDSWMQQLQATPDSGGDAMIMNKELARLLESALLQLPPKYRLVFVLREVEGMNVSETAKALSLSETNIKVRLNRAKTALREKLAAYYKKDLVFGFHLSRCDRMVQSVFKRLQIE
jgi:RNA polymerase sigma factor (sigma-70 family)